MSRTSSIALSAGLIGAGALVCALTGRPLLGDPETNVPLNVLGINRSPYGEVFAMAMQEPIDQYFNHSFDRRPGRNAPQPAHHADDCRTENCDQHGTAADNTPAPPSASARSLTARFRGLIEEMNAAQSSYTHLKPRSETQKRHIRRQVEDKLRFAYQLDPANYGNYNSYHFFITEPQLGTRPELTPSAGRLAQHTIDYCLREQHDPRPALTAAAAVGNVLELMFNDSRNEIPRFTPAQMRQNLALMDQCLGRFDEIFERWTAAGTHQLLSPMRLQEMEDRYTFTRKMRDAAENTIHRLEGQPFPQNAAN